MTRSEVLIIGAGPSGLFAASELARYGVGVRLIEREVRSHREARATAIEPGTLEILDSVGLVSPFLDGAVHVRRSALYGPEMTELSAMTFQGINSRFEFNCSLPQYETERILEAHLASLGGVVERGVTARKVERAENDTQVELVHADGGVEMVDPDVIIGAGGAHSVTRHSMSEPLGGAAYQGHFLVADIAMQAPFPPGESGIVCSREGLLLLAPLPGGRWISFQDLEETAPTLSAEDVVARIAVRLDGRCRPSDVAWFAPFRMQRRIVSRLADDRRFLIGDAAHLSSPFAGEGLNAGLHDGYDLAWKLSLVLRGHGRQSLLDAYAVERMIADQHILEVSDQVHHRVVGIADAIRHGREVPAVVADPVATALLRNATAMIDVDYAGSPLVVDYGASPADAVEPHPGQRYPDRMRFGGTSHHVLVFGPVGDADSLTRLGQRWSGRVEFAHDPGVDPVRAGVPMGGVVLIRPDGHIGFRFPSAEAAAFAALDRHLTSYLLPTRP